MFNMAYAIQCHKDSTQVNRMISNLDCDGVYFFIHVDSKSDIISNIQRKSNVIFVENRMNIEWGGFSQVEATLELLREIKKHGDYSYIHVISGQDFPIKSALKIRDHFMRHVGNQFIESIPIPQKHISRLNVYYPPILLGRGRVRFLRAIYKKVITNSKIFTRDISFLPEVYKGSSWFSITGDCMNYILNFIEENAQFYNFFQNTLCGDEVFFQTIIMNSPFRDKVINDNLRYIKWNENDNSPITFEIHHFDKLAETQKLFARKFDRKIDMEVINKVEELLIQ